MNQSFHLHQVSAINFPLVMHNDNRTFPFSKFLSTAQKRADNSYISQLIKSYMSFYIAAIRLVKSENEIDQRELFIAN